MMRIPLFLFLGLPLGLGLLPGCTSEPVFPVEPRIEFVDIQPREVREYQDSILVTFRFQDGDGNLGALEPGEINLHLIDSRINSGLTEAQATNPFSVPNLTPQTRNPSIQGEVTVKLDFTVLIPGRNEEEIRYQIKFWDRDGNLATPIEDGTESAVYTDYIKIIR